VQHSEFNPSRTEATRLLQIWIKPDAQGVKPRYAEKNLSKAETGKLHLVASKTGREDSMEIHQDADLLLAKLEPGQNVKHSLGKDRAAFVHVAEGEVTINGKTLTGGDAAAVSEEGKLEIAASKPSQVLLFDLN
jgi:redox-sensitive bicupin YhaK (pirin superfamily)